MGVGGVGVGVGCVLATGVGVASVVACAVGVADEVEMSDEVDELLVLEEEAVALEETVIACVVGTEFGIGVKLRVRAGVVAVAEGLGRGASVGTRVNLLVPCAWGERVTRAVAWVRLCPDGR